VLWNLANAALQLGDDRAQQHFYGYALSRAREAGTVTAVVNWLQRLLKAVKNLIRFHNVSLLPDPWVV
jgi:hypothetical protein